MLAWAANSAGGGKTRSSCKTLTMLSPVFVVLVLPVVPVVVVIGCLLLRGSLSASRSSGEGVLDGRFESARIVEVPANFSVFPDDPDLGNELHPERVQSVVGSVSARPGDLGVGEEFLHFAQFV